MQTTDLKIKDCWNRIGVWRTGDDKCPELERIVHCRNCEVYSKVGRKLLRTEPPDNYRSEWTKILAAEKEAKPFNVRSAFIFRAGSEWLALPANMIQEVVNMGLIHSIPNLNSKPLRGLVNIHGRLQICVSIGRVLGIEKLIRDEEKLEPGYTSSERLVLVQQFSRLVAFPVSEVKGIIHYTPDMVKDLPVTVSGSKAAYTMGILHLDGKDIGLLKDKPLFKTLTKDLE
jgi:chemotaxis-related protein WspD